MDMKCLLIVLLHLVGALCPQYVYASTSQSILDGKGNAECDCGPYGTDCLYKGDEKICSCLEGFKQNGELCERCDCRRHTKDCNFVNGNMNCICDEGYIQKDDICVDACSSSKPCQNGGTCSNGVCGCKKGVAGNLCQIVVVCEYDLVCGDDQDTKCVYHVADEKAICGCKNANQVFIKDEKKCRVECGEASGCLNGGECIKIEEGHFCQCRNGTEGDFCENIACDEPCAIGAVCKYDLNLEQSHCECEKNDEVVDPSRKMCRKPCKLDSECKFDAKCAEVMDGIKFCDCKNGTGGSFCETCDLCGVGDDVTCVPNVDGTLQCQCQANGKEFDVMTKMCRKPCESHDDCSNSASCSKRKGWLEDTSETDDQKFCRCREGTSGDRCEVVDDCLPEKNTCGALDDVECRYDKILQRAYCKCLEGGKAFDKEAKVCKDCNCGPYAKSCSFGAGLQICRCDQGYYQSGDECKECACGENSRSCAIYGDQKMCRCEDGYNDNGTTCVECDCGPNSYSCEIYKGRKKCGCKLLYAEKNGYCERTCDENFSKCKNGGICDKGSELCECKKGTNGAHCENIIDCDQFEICGQDTGAICSYDKELEEAYCKCDEDLHQFDEQDMKCKECYCGKHGTCSFVNGEKTCKCSKNFSLKAGTCAECDCGKFGSCDFVGVDKKCNCSNGYGDKDGLCVACPCRDNSAGCLYKGNELICQCNKGFLQKGTKCVECDCGEYGTCSFDSNGKKTCQCYYGYSLSNGRCQKECDDDCENGGSCQTVGGKKFCQCLRGTLGDNCEVIKDCSSTFERCSGENGVCKYRVSDRQAYCECTPGTRYDENYKMCRRPCSKDDQCSNGGICLNKECQCPEGTSGDDCSRADGCKAIEESCKKAGATCKYDPGQPQKAACVCRNEDFVFDQEKESCSVKWCLENECYDKSSCEYDENSRTAYCKCQNPKRYYDYEEKRCKPIDPCQLKTCAENQVCFQGKCKCADGYEDYTNNVCEPKFCNRDPCFSSASCRETDKPGVVNCFCSGSLFFDGSQCEYAPCIIPKHRATYCYEECPPEMVWNDKGYCEPKDEKRKCEKDCVHGWCIKEGEKEVCNCIGDYALLKNGTCILNVNMCASKKLTPDLYKCECSGIYKYSDDEFSCERRSCQDKDVQEECRKVGAASCKDNWRLIAKGPEVGFECVCAPGYGKDATGICREICTLEANVAKCERKNQICYLDENYEPSCRCPPTFFYNDGTQECEYHGKNAFLLKRVPVLKHKYMRKDGSVDRMLLHADVIRSIKTMYSDEALDFAYLSKFETVDNTLFCDVVLQIETTLVGRFDFQLMKNVWCEECDDQVAVLPPSLVLQNNVENVSTESVDFCSESVKNLLCGEGANCKDRKCSCDSGYVMKEGSLMQKDDYTILKCEDIDECQEGFHSCSENTTCVNTPGDFYCQCLPGFKKINELLPFANGINKNRCVDLCSSNPCNRGECNVKNKMLDCKCEVGYVGSLCDIEDVHLRKARNVTKIISGVLGGLLFVTIVLFIIYAVRRQKAKNDSDVYISQVYPSELQERRPQISQDNGHRK